MNQMDDVVTKMIDFLEGQQAIQELGFGFYREAQLKLRPNPVKRPLVTLCGTHWEQRRAFLGGGTEAQCQLSLRLYVPFSFPGERCAPWMEKIVSLLWTFLGNRLSGVAVLEPIPSREAGAWVTEARMDFFAQEEAV